MAGARDVVARFHASFGQTLVLGQRLELVTIAEHHGDRHLYTEFHFRDVDSGAARVWVVDGGRDDDTGRELCAAADDARATGDAAT